MNEEWYYSEDDHQIGPVSFFTLKSLAESGELTANDLVWKDGMADWKPASCIKELFPPSPLATPARKSSPPLVTPVDSSTNENLQVKGNEFIPSETHLQTSTKRIYDEINPQEAPSPLWGWYKRYVAFIWNLIWGVVTATWYAGTRIVGNFLNGQKSDRLKGELAELQVALGESMFTSGIGESLLRQRIVEKNQAIQKAKSSTKGLIAKRQAMLTELAVAGMATHSGEASFSEGVQAVQKAQETLKNHEGRVATLTASRPPINSMRAWIGAGGCVVILALLRGEDKQTAHRAAQQGSNQSTSMAENDRSSAVPTSKKGSKLAAFKEVVSGWERYLDSIGNDDTKKRWLRFMQQAQERFIEIPFDPKADLDNVKEAKQILELAVERLRGTEKIMTTYYDTGQQFEAADEMALWKKLAKHLLDIGEVAEQFR